MGISEQSTTIHDVDETVPVRETMWRPSRE